MTEKEFEKNFPSYKSNDSIWFNNSEKKWLQENCFDRERILDAIDKYESIYGNVKFCEELKKEIEK